MLSIKTQKLRFHISADGAHVCWEADQTLLRTTDGGDFWRMYIDDFKFRDCPVHSAKQSGVARQTSEGLEIEYNHLLDDTGRTVNVRLTVYITVQDEALRFEAVIENHDERIRVNEFALPLVDLSRLCAANRSQDTLYVPNGLGERRSNPWSISKVDTITASSQMYLEPTQNEIFKRYMYPGNLSMGWMGVESGNFFLYLGQHDELFRTCDLTYGASARSISPNLLLEITHFPVVQCGEIERTAPCYIALFEGGWLTGSRFYRQWAENSWWKAPECVPWLQNMTGREKVILRHGNGQILHTYAEIPSIMRRAMECGLSFLEIYGWHAGGQDNDYPNYIPDPEQGGEEQLRKAIEEVHKMGGRIILYGQGELLDTWTDYFKHTGHHICRKNIMHDPYYCFFHYSSGGSLLRRYGCNITHTTACQATEEWHRLMCDETRDFLDYGADGVFWDMEGGPTPVICFDETHLHGTRGDREALWRRQNIVDVHEICLARERSSGIEFPVDFLSMHADYTMGCWEVVKEPCFEMFRCTFPEIVVTNRWCDDENDGYIGMLNEAFLYGLRWNICMFRTRGTLYDVPDFAEYLTKLTTLQKQYARYLLRGDFCMETQLTLPDCIRYSEYKARPDDAGRLFVFWNIGCDIRSFSVGDTRITMQPNSVTCLEWIKNKE